MFGPLDHQLARKLESHSTNDTSVLYSSGPLSYKAWCVVSWKPEFLWSFSFFQSISVNDMNGWTQLKM